MTTTVDIYQVQIIRGEYTGLQFFTDSRSAAAEVNHHNGVRGNRAVLRVHAVPVSVDGIVEALNNLP